jgi:ribosomal protein S28E/S33
MERTMEVVQLINRTGQRIDFMYDSLPYTIEPHKSVVVPAACAWHAYYKHVAKLDPNSGQAIYLLGIKASDGTELTECSQLDYARGRDEELIDRSGMEGNFKTVRFANPDLAKGRVVPIQMAGAFSQHADEHSSGKAFAEEVSDGTEQD